MNGPIVHNKYHDTAPPGAVYIGRGSPFGNPFVIGEDGTRSEVLARYRYYLFQNPELIAKIKAELPGKDLVCFCAPRACHGDFLLEIAKDSTS